MQAIETYKFTDGKQLEIILDDSPESPREWCTLGKMVCFHNRYNLGDHTDYDYTDYANWDEMQEVIKTDNPDCVILPIYMYDHSDITINTTGFSCPWDSGQIGFIFISRERINEVYGNHDGRSNEEIEKYLRDEVATYDQYLRGDVYGFILRGKNCETCDGEGENEDSCWGFYGSDPVQNGMLDHLDETYRQELQQTV